MAILIVGASLAGLRTAQALRGNGFQGEIVLAGDETELPYDRPPLSKEFLVGEEDDDAIRLCTADELHQLGVSWRGGFRAVAVDAGAYTVEFANGQRLPYDDLVIATGARPRSLPAFAGDDRAHLLRTADDSRRLRAALLAAADVTIIGGGFIGAEVASSALVLGCRVTVLEALDAPMARVLGLAVGQRLARVLTDAGVDLRCGATVTGADQVSAEVIVVGIGTVPNTQWLEGSGATTANGVACDETGRVAGLDHVYAAGDVAAWFDDASGAHRRTEHWTAATEHAEVVAQMIVGGARTLPVQVPYVWSDQFGHRIQVAGRFGTGQFEVVRDDDTAYIAMAELDGLLGGVVALDSPRALAVLRRLIAKRTSWPDALDAAAKLRA